VAMLLDGGTVEWPKPSSRSSIIGRARLGER
jgi:hypothetical protein